MIDEFKVLLIEDSPDERRLVKLELAEIQEPQIQVEEVNRLSEATRRLKKPGIDVVLLDLSLPDATGLGGVSTLRAQFPSIPIVVLTGFDDERMAIAALREGAEDYLVKDSAKATVLRRVLLHAIERKRVTEAMLATRDRFREAQRLEALGRLAGGIAHDFNNMLTSILGYSSILCAELEDPQSRADAEEIQKAGERAADLTRQILAFSRRDQPRLEAVDVNEVVDHMVRMLNRLLPKQTTLDLELQHPLPWVRADRGHLEQVILNLVVNARDAMPEGGRILVETSSVEVGEARKERLGLREEGTYTRLSVADSGCGIAPEELSRIFDPFYTTKPEGRGTGLGLSTVYGILRSCNGAIEVESDLGSGTRMTVYLPLSEESIVESSSSCEVSPTGRTATVLAVEPSPSLRRLIQKVLEKAGFEVRLAADPGEAEDLFDSTVDLLIVARQFGRTPGLELARRLHRRSPQLRVVMLTSHAEDHIKSEHPLPILLKPFTPGRLLTRVEEVLDAPPPLLPEPTAQGPDPFNETLEAVFARCPEAIFVLDEDGGIRPCNPTALALKADPVNLAEALSMAQTWPIDEHRRGCLVRSKAQVIRSEPRARLELAHLQYVLSHDLQEPLRMVVGYLELLGRRSAGTLPPDQAEFVAFAIDGARRMQQMLTGLLFLSRLEGVAVEGGEADCETAFQSSLERLGAVDANINWLGPRPVIPMPERLLEEVFFQLLSNATKFRGPETPSVVVECVDAGAQWLMTVSDNGPGLPSEDTERCFRLFGRLHGREEFPGVGLGLHLCQTIIARCKGTISIRNRRRERGVVVSLTLPRRPEVRQEQAC
ncbi:MAG: response regulator [Candidatus Eremiobacteraeota bacterium]|nr:response regulator [Candidatus Eremiobacteraeota bacterium]